MKGLLIALGLLLAATWVGGGYALYYVIRDDNAWSKKAAAETLQLHDAERKIAQLQTDKAHVDSQLQTSQTELMHPTLGIWNSNATITGPDVYLSGGMPDAFTYHLRFTADAPISVTYMSTKQFAAAIGCVEAGRGTTHTCFSGTGQGWRDVTTLDVDIHEAEGCADYLVIFTAARATTIHPNVSITYNPARTVTGACVA
jgi:hypothetical protein